MYSVRLRASRTLRRDKASSSCSRVPVAAVCTYSVIEIPLFVEPRAVFSMTDITRLILVKMENQLPAVAVGIWFFFWHFEDDFQRSGTTFLFRVSPCPLLHFHAGGACCDHAKICASYPDVKHLGRLLHVRCFGISQTFLRDRRTMHTLRLECLRSEIVYLVTFIPRVTVSEQL